MAALTGSATAFALQDADRARRWRSQSALCGCSSHSSTCTGLTPGTGSDFWFRSNWTHSRTQLGVNRGAVSGAQEATASPERTSLIPETMADLDTDQEYQQLQQQLRERGQQQLTREERRKRQRSLEAVGAPSFAGICKERGVSPLRRRAARTFQLNIGLYCNQACGHCHVESSPLRSEMMDRATAERCVQLMAASRGTLSTVDVTGGAPELNSQFRYLVGEARALGLEVIDRCNLTVLLEPGQEDLVPFLAHHQVRVVASLPCYSEQNVDQQRGAGVFHRSIQGLQMLNAAGYGREGSGLILDLVYNPGGAFLAPPQAALQEAYRQELGEAYGISFSSLLALNNMPIKRFTDYLTRRGQLPDYMHLLVQAFNPAAAEGVMCRDTVSVGWDGRIYDCDFNQQLEIGLQHGGKANVSVFDIDDLSELTGNPIALDSHCYGCTAGAGSSCQGSTA